MHFTRVLLVSLSAGVLWTAGDAYAEERVVEQLYPSRELLAKGEFMQRVLERNSLIQARLAGFHAARGLHRAERGLFEPALVGTTQFVDRQRPNTIEIERSLQSGGIFIERNLSHSAGLEVRTPLGGRVRVGGAARKLRNNVQRQVIVELDAEYEASLEVLLEQPLLKGAGLGTTLAPRRMAERAKEIAFQDFRRELMQTVARAEIAYWELSLAQQQLRYTSGSVRIAESLLEDNRTLFEAGRGTALDVIEAEAGLALRRSRESMARQGLVQGINRLAAFFGGRPQSDGVQYQAIESPRIRPVYVPYEEGAETALSMSSDFLRARQVVEQEKLRVQVARNQRLPQVDLRGIFGSAGLGFDWNSAYADIERTEFPQWTVGLELRIPIAAGIRERNELYAARQRLRHAEYNVRDLEGHIRTELDAAIRGVETSETTVRSNRAAVDFREKLLADRLLAREAGRIDTRTVLEAEEELVHARLSLLESEVEYERAVLELELLHGSLLENRGIELTVEQLERLSQEWSRGSALDLEFMRYRDPHAAPVPASMTTEVVR